MECQNVLIIALLMVAIKAEMLRPTNDPSSSAQPHKEPILYITPKHHINPVVEPKDTGDLQAYGIRQKQYSTKIPNIHLPLSPTEKDLNEFKNLFFRTVTSKNGNQVLEPLKVYVKSTQEPLNQDALYSTLNPEQRTAPKNLFDPGASKRDAAGSKKDMQYSQKYQLIPYEFDTQGGILKEGPAILNSAFEIIIAPQKESVHQHQKDYYHIDNYFDFETVAKEREKARMTAEMIAKSPPILVQSDINISRRLPVDIIKTIKVPIPSPYLVPIPERYPVPQPYAVPFEIIRPYAVPVVKTEKIEVERPVPVEVEKHVHSPVEKKVFVRVEKPYPVDKVVPVEVKREVPYEVPIYNLARYSIVKHVWDN